MAQFILKKILVLPVLLIFISIVVFSIQVLVPGDPIAIMLLGEEPSEELVTRLRAEMGLDKPVHEQFFLFFTNALKGDLGTSYRSRRPVTAEISSRFPRTLQLAFVALGISGVIGISAGVIASYKKDSIFDLGSMLFALVGLSMPVFWLGLLFIDLFSVRLGWFPVFGSGTWRHLVLPAFTLGIINSAIVARITRSSMLEELRKDYIRTARAKGLKENKVLLFHALKNALIPIVTVMGLRFGNLLGSAFITETVFAWHGIGELGVQAIQTRDFPLVQGVVLTVACSYVIINTLVDILYGYLNPRIRLR